MNTQAKRPLEGIRVLDFTHAAAGPFATLALGDMGAEVIKIEKQGRGDGIRHVAEYFVALNRNKKGICLDLSLPEGVQLARDLAGRSDIVVENFRPGVMERLGLGYEDLRKLRTGLVYCSISAFGQTGPWSDRPANDIILQSVSGLMSITGEVDGGPVRIGAPIADYSSGLFALSGILGALFARDRYPEGQHIEVSMLDSAFAMMANYVPSVARGARIPRVGRGHAQIVPYQAFLCADNEYVMVGAFTQGFWKSLCRVVDKPEWLDDPRFKNNALRLKHRKELLPELEDIFRAKPRAQWLRLLEEADVPTSPVLELHDALFTEQAVHNEVLQTLGDPEHGVRVARSPIRAAQWPGVQDRMAPAMGEDTEKVLGELLGLDRAAIEQLAAKGVIAWGEAAARRSRDG